MAVIKNESLFWDFGHRLIVIEISVIVSRRLHSRPTFHEQTK